MQQVSAVGRRKTAVARVHLREGKGKITVNGKSFEEFFGKRRAFPETVQAPFDETKTKDRFDLVITVRGGGVQGQIEAVRHGIARALEKTNPELRAALKKAGFLTRDPREKERKKYGLAKARKRYQYSKR